MSNSNEAKTPLEQVKETQQALNANLAEARKDQAMQQETEDVEQHRVDRTTDVPGSIGHSGSAPNPREHPQRNTNA